MKLVRLLLAILMIITMTSCTTSTEEPTAEQVAKSFLLREVPHMKPRTTEWLEVELLEQTQGKLGRVTPKTDDTYTFYLFRIVARYNDGEGNRREQGFLTIVRVDEEGNWWGGGSAIKTVKESPSDTVVIRYMKIEVGWPRD